MARRYSDIRRGGELKFALDNYTNYMSDMTTRKTKRMVGGTPGDRIINYIEFYIRPFAQVAAATEVCQVRGTDSGLVAGGPKFDVIADFGTGAGARFTTEVGTSTIIPTPQGLRPARATAFKPDGTKAYVPSKVTQLHYLKYGGNSGTVPFGRQQSVAGDTESQTEGTVYSDAKRAILDSLGRYGRCSIKDERFKVA